MSRSGLCVAAMALAACGLSTAAWTQVAYQPVPPDALPYGYPVPGGVLQPNETLGTSPSIQLFPDAYGAAPAVRIVRQCQYPDGWNVTDYARDVNGTPGGLEHACPVAPLRATRVRARY